LNQWDGQFAEQRSRQPGDADNGRDVHAKLMPLKLAVGAAHSAMELDGCCGERSV
jgi:hypothetical protein